MKSKWFTVRDGVTAKYYPVRRVKRLFRKPTLDIFNEGFYNKQKCQLLVKKLNSKKRKIRRVRV